MQVDIYCAYMVNLINRPTKYATIFDTNDIINTFCQINININLAKKYFQQLYNFL